MREELLFKLCWFAIVGLLGIGVLIPFGKWIEDSKSGNRLADWWIERLLK